MEALILDILESPLRVRNALIGTLRLREKQRDREVRRQVTAAATGQKESVFQAPQVVQFQVAIERTS